MTGREAPADLRVETPSGKGASDENFPVASRLIAPHLRPHVLAFYDFVRAADDIADNPNLDPQDKLIRLDQMEASLHVDGPLTKPRRLAETFAATGVTDAYARDMLSAFRQDTTKQRYRDLDELWDYCDRSAAPVGRFLVDLHREDQNCHNGAGALANVLQVLNHIQDCQSDFLTMDRVYLPQDMWSAHGAQIEDLRGPALTPSLRAMLNALLDACATRMGAARQLVGEIRSRSFAAETQAVVALATRLLQRLRNEDPIAGRVALTKVDFSRAAAQGVGRYLRPRWG
ncbi:MAG: squalene/phytoene synthase family protein [Pseudomonadota bacterium]